MCAGNEGIDAFDAVNKVSSFEPFERSINLRRRPNARGPDGFQEFISSQGTALTNKFVIDGGFIYAQVARDYHGNLERPEHK